MSRSGPHVGLSSIPCLAASVFSHNSSEGALSPCLYRRRFTKRWPQQECSSSDRQKKTSHEQKETKNSTGDRHQSAYPKNWHMTYGQNSTDKACKFKRAGFEKHGAVHIGVEPIGECGRESCCQGIGHGQTNGGKWGHSAGNHPGNG